MCRMFSTQWLQNATIIFDLYRFFHQVLECTYKKSIQNFGVILEIERENLGN